MLNVIKFITILSLGAVALSKPTGARRHPVQSRTHASPSFNNFHGLSSLSNFDNFFGSSNFDGSSNSEVIVEQQEQVVCEQIDVEVIQQRMTVIREFVKRVLLEQVCEVEVQTLVLTQFSSGIESFSRDIRRVSQRSISFDSSISSMFSQLVDSPGNLSSDNLGFSGASVGSHGVSVGGSNWNDNTSPASVGSIYQSAMSALHNSQAQNATAPALTVTASATSSASTSSATA